MLKLFADVTTVFFFVSIDLPFFAFAGPKTLSKSHPLTFYTFLYFLLYLFSLFLISSDIFFSLLTYLPTDFDTSKKLIIPSNKTKLLKQGTKAKFENFSLFVMFFTQE